MLSNGLNKNFVIKFINMDDYENKNEHPLIISTYNDHEIHLDTCMSSIFSLFTVYFLLQKISDNLMAKWQACFYPMYLLFIILFIKYFVKIIYSEIYETSQVKGVIKVVNIERVVLISNFFKFLYSPLFFLLFYYVAEFLDKRDDIYLFYSLYLLITICITQILYSLLRQLPIFNLRIKSDPSDGQADNHSLFGFVSSLIAPALTYCSNMMIVCSSSGVCTQVYMSTIASLLGAFGVTLSDFSEYLFPITIVLLGISLFSLYIKRKKLLHKPFLLGVFACVLIILSHVFEECSLMIYPGNVLMVGAAIWNARVNNFYGLPQFVK
jgi:hypothetical protein